MKNLKEEQMKKVKGGAINWGLMTGFGAVASFLIGIIDGLMNPQRCNR